MARVLVKLYGVLKVVANEHKVIIGAENIMGLLRRLVDRYGDEIKECLFENGKLRPYTNIFVNKKHVKQLNYLLSDGDEVSILPSAGGGMLKLKFREEICDAAKIQIFAT